MNQLPRVVYQVYPKSFMDTNGDGIGDLNGVISKLDYLAELSVDTIWLSPIFASPMVDNGYDISDYCAVSPEFGTMDDLDRLIAEAKKRNMGILLDLVLNHTSDRHEWFKEAMRDPKSPYRDYYIFRKGIDGGPPNNWRSNFGGSAWERDEVTGEYYLHIFAKEQPDLNWENPAMRRELFDMIRGYLEKGVSGFRIDAISGIKKRQDFPSLPPDAPDGLANGESCWTVYPGIEAFLSEMRDSVFKPYGAYTVAEAAGVDYERLPEFIGENGYFSAVFDFSYTDIDLENGLWYTSRRVEPKQLRESVFASQKAVCAAGCGAVYLENHDQNRSCNKYLAPVDSTTAGKAMLGVMYFFLQGSAYIYQGQELGIPNYPWADIAEFDDVATIDQYRRGLSAGLSERAALEAVAHRSRDNARTPMLWDKSECAGFSTGRPWLPVHPDFQSLCAEEQDAQDVSLLRFYRRMSALRQGEYAKLFLTGTLAPRFEEYENIFAYERQLESQRILVVCNWQSTPQTLCLPGGRILLDNLREEEQIGGQTALAPFEALVALLEENL